MCNHNFKVVSGKDKCNSERYCTKCGKIEIYSGIIHEWINMGFLKDLDETKENSVLA
jgi:hypothetical protein